MQPLPELIAFLESLAEPHILFDAQYRIVAANTAYRRQFSPERAVVGRRCYEVSHHYAVPCDQAGESCPLAQSRRSGQRERVLHLHHTPRGQEYVNIELIPLPGTDGVPAFYVEKMEPLRMAYGEPAAQGLIGRSEPFQRMLALVARVAPSRASVLLLGESGTGKELVARAVHDASTRAHKPFVPVDCSSLPESLFESELFGHERGAFTGANAARAGLVEAASGGTLFLDEVGDIPLPMQVKLLRLLETGTYRRVGSTELRHADLRVVAATHRDLEAMVAEGRFREDLYYRLATFPIHLPPLRARGDDVALLAQALLERVAPRAGLRLSAAALQRLRAYPFPGNVRELRNLLERAALLCNGAVIEAEHIELALSTGRAPRHPVAGRTWTDHTPAVVPAVPATADLVPGTADATTAAPTPASTAGTDWRALERETLRAFLQQHRGSRAELAQRLGISERTLYRKLKALGLSVRRGSAGRAD